VTRWRSAAFTLVELLVVLMMTVLLVTSAAAFMRVVAGARQVTDTRLQGEQEANVALRTITSALRNAYRPVTDNDVLFEGVTQNSDAIPNCRVRFRTIDRRIIRKGQPESDVHEIEFFIRDDGVKPMLMRRSDPTKNPDPDGGGVVEPLAIDVVGLDVQYFDGEKWLDHWLETRKKWPTAVNVRLIYRDDSTPGSTQLGAVSSIVNFPHWESGQTTASDQDENATQQQQK
jgi:type II secretion system protein J